MTLPASWQGGAIAPMPSHPDTTTVLQRFEWERSRLRALPGLPAASATLLAGRAAGTLLRLWPQARRQAAQADDSAPYFDHLAGELPPIAQLTSCWRFLAQLCGDDEDAPDIAALQIVAQLWPFAASAEALLVQGGDDRLSLDPATARNRYLCTPWPQPETISFSSCTASIISPRGLEAAEQRRRMLLATALQDTADTALAQSSAAISAAILSYFGVEETAEAVLTASGTDATLLLTGLLAAERPRQTITTILMSPSETGSGVPEAARGRHFAPCTAAGFAVEKGGAVDGFPPGLSLASVALRTPAGMPRAPEAIAADCEAAIDAACATGHVVLHAIDGTKTGLSAPDLLALDLLAERFRGRLDIVIDACQLRVEPETIRLYLNRGWPVLITGSKFFGAPGFCGAILFPRARLRRITGIRRIPGGLHAYTSAADGSLSRRCPGLLLRWAAALAEMQVFARLPARDIAASIDEGGAAVRAAIMRESRLKLMPAPRPARDEWSERPSVLTFAVLGEDGPLSASALRALYLALGEDCSDRLAGGRSDEEREIAARICLIGQPVQLGGPDIGGLRIALSAAQISAGRDLRPALATVFGKLGLLLDEGLAATP